MEASKNIEKLQEQVTKILKNTAGNMLEQQILEDLTTSINRLIVQAWYFGCKNNFTQQ